MTTQFQHWRQPPLHEDAREFLARLDLPVCIVSNIDRSDLEAALDHHGLVFDHVVTSDDVRSYKPRPEPFRRAMEHLGVRGDALLHVGDSLSSDVAGPTASGRRWPGSTARPRDPGEASLWAEVRNLVELADLLEEQPRRPS